MATIISTNITSPLGFTTEENYQAVREGKSGLNHYSCENGGWRGLPFDIEASLFSDSQWEHLNADGYSRFESLVLHSVRDAMSKIIINKQKTIFILSSTKGDVELLDEGKDVPSLGDIARKISAAVGIETEPVAVCNACISGVSALILAQRLIDCGSYSHAVVCGADVLSRFIVSGFQSFKALSSEPCRPFDIERLGLNLGEAAATVVLSRETSAETWTIDNGVMCNDAYHISAPHPKGEGAYRVLKYLKAHLKEELAEIGVHGTATMYNDQMESMAITRAELQNVPLSALKGYFGHTMGAAGVLETILTARALDDGIILPSKGYDTRGVSGKVKLYDAPVATDKSCFIKMLSGFGGCNGAVSVRQKDMPGIICNDVKLSRKHGVYVYEKGAELDGQTLDEADGFIGKDVLTEVYKKRIGDYPKFYKMDMLSKLAFVATELLIQSEHSEADHSEDRAIVLFNHSSSILADKHYEKSISNNEGFFPSPAAFVYTLPNITTGEVAIRHGYHGETSFYVLPCKDEHLMSEIIKATFCDTRIKSIICGWIDCESENEFECELSIYQI